MNKNIKIFETPSDLALTAAKELLSETKKSAEKNENFYLALSGGSTPVILFNILSKEPFNKSVSWNKIHLFWADERCVAPESDESNYGTTKKILLDKINIPLNNIHRIKGERNPDDEAERYADEIKRIVPAKNNLPSFNLILLGIGEDGHTASLFPGKKLDSVFNNISGTTTHPVSGQRRISLTKELINNAEKISFLITGENKAEIISKIFDQNNNEVFPAGEIKSITGNLTWNLDKAAAKYLK